MPRLFTALDLPDPIQDELDALEAPIEGFRWLEADQRHLTLRFIGEVDRGAYREIAEALTGIEGLPFELTLRGIGHFPPRGAPQTLWAGVEPNPELDRLKQAADRALREAGLDRDPRRFLPHVTLARLRHPPPHDAFAAYLMRHALFRSSPFIVQGFGLYSSRLHPDGARYIEEERYDLMTVDDDDAGW